MAHIEYRAVFSYPDSYLGPTPNSYSDPTDDPDRLPTHCPRSEETLGWVSGTEIRTATEWQDAEALVKRLLEQANAQT